jgi:hypothetical protein
MNQEDKELIQIVTKDILVDITILIMMAGLFYVSYIVLG